MKKHNGIISFWKFAFCLVILIFHVGEFAPKSQFVLFKGGSIGVEFFFIVSGYFMAASALKKDKLENSMGEETFYYIWKKIKGFFPYIVITYVFSIILKLTLDQMTIKNYVLSIWDLLLLRYAGFKAANIINHVWYILAMLLCMALIYPQIKKFKKNYFYFIAPLTVIFIAGYISHSFGNLKDPHEWVGFMYKGLPRAYFELVLGSLLYPMVEKIKKIDFTKFGKILLTLVEIGGFVITVLAAHYLSSVYDFVLVLILAVSILIALSSKTLEFELCNNKLFYYLEKLSLTMYLIHLPIRNFVRDYYIQTGIYYNYWLQLAIILLLSVILGLAMIWFVDYLKKNKFFIPVIKRLLIVYKEEEIEV